ncbi:hypothetical protein C3L33_07942, partial [Rhododendron williamsianum]
MDILAHPSIGGSLFHAGWGSAIETLQFGHCLVVLPLIIDQGLNARFLVEKGLAIEVERGEDGSFRRSDIATALRQAMVGKEGEGMRARLRDVAPVVGDQEIHDGYIAGLVEYLKNREEDRTVIERINWFFVCFYAYSAAVCAFLGPSEYLAGDGRKRVSFPSSIAFRTHEAILVHPGLYGNNGTGKPDADRLAKILESCHAIAVRRRGKVCIGWAPQMEILGHKSIGGSLFHSGWGSVIETLQFGHCLVLLPFIIDQGLHARLLVEKGLGIEVERREDGSFTGNDIAESLRRAMVSEEGEGMRARAREAAAIFGERRLHDQYIADFAEYLKHEAVKQG